MPSLLIHEGTFYSPLDEEAFFRWLASIPGVRRITGTAEGLQVTLRTATLSEPALRDLIALHWRYKLPMRDLREFKTEKNEAWFCNTAAYWFEAIFGPAAVPANMELRLAALRQDGSSPVHAIKTIHKEYAVSLGEAKRRLSLSPSWTTIAKANVILQEEAISIGTCTTKARARSAA
jgi:hypothetical protein